MAKLLECREQPWGLSIAEVTVRASGEGFIL